MKNVLRVFLLLLVLCLLAFSLWLNYEYRLKDRTVPKTAYDTPMPEYNGDEWLSATEKSRRASLGKPNPDIINEPLNPYHGETEKWFPNA